MCGCCLFCCFWVGLLLVSFFWGNLISITCLFQLLTDHVSHLSGNAGKKIFSSLCITCEAQCEEPNHQQISSLDSSELNSCLLLQLPFLLLLCFHLETSTKWLLFIMSFPAQGNVPSPTSLLTRLKVEKKIRTEPSIQEPCTFHYVVTR